MRTQAIGRFRFRAKSQLNCFGRPQLWSCKRMLAELELPRNMPMKVIKIYQSWCCFVSARIYHFLLEHSTKAPCHAKSLDVLLNISGHGSCPREFIQRAMIASVNWRLKSRRVIGRYLLQQSRQWYVNFYNAFISLLCYLWYFIITCKIIIASGNNIYFISIEKFRSRGYPCYCRPLFCQHGLQS